MIQDNVVKLIQPAEFSDPLTEVLREGARALLAQAVEAEVAAFLSGHADRQTGDGRQRLVRHGHRPERAIMTGLGPVPVRAPRVRDRTGAGESRIRFTSAILPPYARRSKSLEVLIPILYLKGISSGDFEDALSALLGPDAGGLSASSIARLRRLRRGEHARWSKRDLAAKRYVYFWSDGIDVQARLEAEPRPSGHARDGLRLDANRTRTRPSLARRFIVPSPVDASNHALPAEVDRDHLMSGAGLREPPIEPDLPIDPHRALLCPRLSVRGRTGAGLEGPGLHLPTEPGATSQGSRWRASTPQVVPHGVV